MSSDPFFLQDLDVPYPPLPAPCHTCSQANRGGFCGAKIQPECLRIDADGVVRVSLSSGLREWFETLGRLGEVLHLARNPIGVLGRFGRIPRLEDWRNAVFPRDQAGLIAPNLAEYAGLWAVREISPLGVVHGLEVRDISGTVFERVLLPLGANRELYEQFVVDHQSLPEESGNWFPANHAGSTRQRAKLAGRIPWFRSRSAKGAGNIHPLPVAFLPRLLATAARTGFPIRTAHFNRALTRSAVWSPQVNPAKGNHDGAESEFFHGDGVGLQLSLEAVASVWLWTGKCACCAEHRWSVEIGDTQESLGLAVTAGDENLEADWRDLIKTCLP